MDTDLELPDGVDEDDELAVRAEMVAYARRRTEALGYTLSDRVLSLAERYMGGDFTDEEFCERIAPRTLH